MVENVTNKWNENGRENERMKTATERTARKVDHTKQEEKSDGECVKFMQLPKMTMKSWRLIGTCVQLSWCASHRIERDAAMLGNERDVELNDWEYKRRIRLVFVCLVFFSSLCHIFLTPEISTFSRIGIMALTYFFPFTTNVRLGFPADHPLSIRICICCCFGWCILVSLNAFGAIHPIRPMVFCQAGR